jgi:anti-sigma28 factor (negative regulator of flagellin synthesis)
MKIVNDLPNVQPVTKVDARPVERTERVAETRDGVSLSADARWVSALKDEVRRPPEVRTDVVERTREALAAGTYEASVDLDTLVTNLLADL